MVIHPSGEPLSAFVLRARWLERTGAAGGRRIRADRLSWFDRGKAEREWLAGWTLLGIGRPIIGEIILTEEPELLVSRGDRTGDVGRDSCFQTGLDLLAVVVAHLRHSIEGTAEDDFGLQRHRPEPIPVARIVGHVVGDEELVLPGHGRFTRSVGW